MSKCIKIVFTLSLLLNLALAGVGVGCLWQKFNRPMPFSNTAPETQALFKKNFEANREAMRADIDAIRAVRTTLEPIITAEKFDRKAYNAEVGKVLKARDKMGNRRADILGDILAELPQAERQKIAHKILAKLTDDDRRGGTHRGHGDRKGPPSESSPAQ
jgi:Spy/CpxP family protein refolding chaperone